MARASAFSVGLIYGSMKLKVLKVCILSPLSNFVRCEIVIAICESHFLNLKEDLFVCFMANLNIMLLKIYSCWCFFLFFSF